MSVDSADPDQIALEQSGQGLHCLPVSLLNVHITFIQKRKVNVQAFPFKGKPKNNTVQVSFGGKNACIFGCTRLTQDTCIIHQRKYPYEVLITIKVLNIGTDSSDPDHTAPNYEQSDQGLHCFAFPPASFTGICIHCNKKKSDV